MSSIPTLAACLMVRDCAEHLERCLASLQGEVDAVYVTDTGSKDRTVEVARSFGAKIRFFPWCDDFSAARNASLEAVSEDWILVLDSDDAFLPGALHGVRKWLVPEACAATVRYSIAPTHTPLRAVRFYRNHLGCRYEGIIHESAGDWLRARRAEGWKQADLPVTLHHYGYTVDQVPGKIARNLPLLQREWERLQAGGPEASRLHVGAELGMALAKHGRVAEATHWFEPLWQGAVENPLAPVTAVMKVLLCRLWLLETEREAEARRPLLQEAEARCAGGAAYQLKRGLFELETGDAASALVWLERFRSGTEVTEPGAELELEVAVPVEFLGVRLWEALGQCNLLLKRYRDAASWFQRCAEAAPGVSEYPLRLRVAEAMAGREAS